MSNLGELCQHRWESILVALGVPENLLNKKHQPCPLCEGGTDRFRWTDHLGTGAYICSQCGSGDGIKFLMEFTGKDFKTVATDIESILGATEARPPKLADPGKLKEKLNAAWCGAYPLSKGCPSHRYLLNRGLKGIKFSDVENVRCHPAMTYWDSARGDKPVDCGKHPAMLALVVGPDGSSLTVHVTYLTPEGKKIDRKPARKVMQSPHKYYGGAVRLQTLQPGQILCVAEGIETALAMKLLYPDLCPWACISSGGLERFEPPKFREMEDVQTIYIAADADLSYTGQAAAYGLAKRLSRDYKPSVLMPAEMGSDFLDQLNTQDAA
ncbi:primase-helicase zinc-binding domain-containing protein [uncultured Paraglaciecola sp.]|uniref:DUF7146 domain-containing protein n=1 Tax=uncultured Paraglaciecola sp. TaxID=1765024 RepID=UPI002608831B|nr:primase-helicase zinc-binding domain-containing protein [uncultured Paraglaciecola sp.]